jgi:hypothetical protein
MFKDDKTVLHFDRPEGNLFLNNNNNQFWPLCRATPLLL